VQFDLPFAQQDETDEPAGGDAGLRATESHPVIEFVRVRRARRYILRVRPDGTLRVTVPRGGSRREAEQFVQKHQRWISGERQRVQVEHAPRQWQHGSEILLHGTRVQIAVEADPVERVIRYGPRTITAPADADVRATVEDDLRELARAELIPRLRELATLHNLHVGSVSIRNQRSRWGSCARSGNIALNFRLVQMPAYVRDYVLVHELMHLKQQNHSRRFWRLVEAVYPDFREAERWLRLEGKSLF
jgi:predicted metal-dependent hydrolase